MFDADDETRRQFALDAASRLLPAITDESWPGHSALPFWKKYEPRLRPCSEDGTLVNYVKEHQILPPFGMSATDHGDIRRVGAAVES